jgi:DNA polymerase-3 subunit gamma/tau
VTPTRQPQAKQAAKPAPRGQRRPGSDAPPPDEPPFDPDYDRPPASGPAYEGFDPGDEPLDDAVSPAEAVRSSEEQAIKLLTEQLGAERIGGDDPLTR